MYLDESVLPTRLFGSSMQPLQTRFEENQKREATLWEILCGAAGQFPTSEGKDPGQRRVAPNQKAASRSVFDCVSASGQRRTFWHKCPAGAKESGVKASAAWGNEQTSRP
jgi:hypothetical protein